MNQLIRDLDDLIGNTIPVALHSIDDVMAHIRETDNNPKIRMPLAGESSEEIDRYTDCLLRSKRVLHRLLTEYKQIKSKQ